MRKDKQTEQAQEKISLRRLPEISLMMMLLAGFELWRYSMYYYNMIVSEGQTGGRKSMRNRKARQGKATHVRPQSSLREQQLCQSMSVHGFCCVPRQRACVRAQWAPSRTSNDYSAEG